MISENQKRYCFFKRDENLQGIDLYLSVQRNTPSRCSKVKFLLKSLTTINQLTGFFLVKGNFQESDFL